MNNNFLPYQLKKNAEQNSTLASQMAQITSQVNPLLDFKAVSYANQYSTGYSDPARQTLIASLPQYGINTVTFMPTVGMMNNTDSVVEYSVIQGDSGLTDAITQCKNLGMKVILKPMVSGSNTKNPTDLTTWFNNYQTFIMRYANIAKQYNVDVLCIGNEFKLFSATTTSQWTNIINQVKTVYTGKLTYAATISEKDNIGFWNLLDYIGINAYYNLTNYNDPTLTDLQAAWFYNKDGQFPIDEISAIGGKYGKQILITEIGYMHYQGCNSAPEVVGSTVDYTEQANCYTTAIDTLMNMGNVKGISLFMIDNPGDHDNSNNPWTNGMDLLNNSTVTNYLKTKWKVN